MFSHKPLIDMTVGVHHGINLISQSLSLIPVSGMGRASAR
jgi:hypothetical protein